MTAKEIIEKSLRQAKASGLAERQAEEYASAIVDTLKPGDPESKPFVDRVEARVKRNGGSDCVRHLRTKGVLA